MRPKTPLNPIFAANFRRLFDQQKLSRKDIMRACEVSETTVGDWFEGKAPTDANMVPLADFLGVPPGYLRYGDAQINEHLFLRICEELLKVTVRDGKDLADPRIARLMSRTYRRCSATGQDPAEFIADVASVMLDTAA